MKRSSNFLHPVSEPNWHKIGGSEGRQCVPHELFVALTITQEIIVRVSSNKFQLWTPQQTKSLHECETALISQVSHGDDLGVIFGVGYGVKVALAAVAGITQHFCLKKIRVTWKFVMPLSQMLRSISRRPRNRM